MRTQFSKIALAAALGLAITFTLSCSSGGGGGDAACGGKLYDTGKYGCVNNELVGTCGGRYYNPENEQCLNGEIQNGAEITLPSSGSGGGNNQFNENSQIYNEDGSIYTGSGIIEISFGVNHHEDGSYSWDGLIAGSVTNGIVRLNLPQSIPNKYLEPLLSDESSCTNYPKDIKGTRRSFVLTNSNRDYLGKLEILYMDEYVQEGIDYMYLSKTGKITCNIKSKYEHYHGGESEIGEESIILNIDAKSGWNKVYFNENDAEKIRRYSTNNILTKKVNWIISDVPAKSSSSQPQVAVSSSSSVPSSSSVAVSSSSTPPSSSSVAPSSSSAFPSSSSVAVPSSSSSSPQTGIVNGTPVTYQGETYQTVVIGNQTWMAKNLNYNAEGSKCYDDDTANCSKYGRLYDWVTAMALPDSCNSNSCSSQIGAKHRGICPQGWYIPSNADWDKLVRYVDGSSGTSSPYESPTAGRYLKSTSGWYSSGNGEDKYGFSALPGGGGYSGGAFNPVGHYGIWWSASEDGSFGAYLRYTGFNREDVGYSSYLKSYLCSVRCLQD